MVRRTKVETQRTRASIVDAALFEFAERGVQTPSLEDVARRAGVTRGAVYWHFADRSALISEVLSGLAWPIDIGADLDVYRAHPQPLRSLGQHMLRGIQRCVGDPRRWKEAQIVLSLRDFAELAPDAQKHLRDAKEDALRRLGCVMIIARDRGQLRAGLDPLLVASGLHAVGQSLLLDSMAGQWPQARPLCAIALEIFLSGATAPSSAVPCFSN